MPIGHRRAVQLLIRQAFEVMDSQIVGLPPWATTERYDILAKAPEGVRTAEAMRPLLRALLADRFELATHRETREMPVFAIVRARTDGGFEPGFREALVGRTLIDETGITARVQIRLAYRPQGLAVQSPDGAADDRPDLFTALEEQAGLKVESRRAPVDLLVIDTLERPTPD